MGTLLVEVSPGSVGDKLFTISNGIACSIKYGKSVIFIDRTGSNNKSDYNNVFYNNWNAIFASTKKSFTSGPVEDIPKSDSNDNYYCLRNTKPENAGLVEMWR